MVRGDVFLVIPGSALPGGSAGIALPPINGALAVDKQGAVVATHPGTLTTGRPGTIS